MPLLYTNIFDSRYLKYETNSKAPYVDYGEIVAIINEKLVNVNMGGQRDISGNMVILEALPLEGNFAPQIGDWVGVEWRNGMPVAIGGGGGGASSGLVNINDSVKIISTSDITGDVINSGHIQTNTIEARHIKVQAIEAQHISADSIESQHISSNSIQAQHISANAVTAQAISSNTIQARHITADAITAVNISANAIQTQHISAGSVTTNQISANSITSSLIKAGAINATHITANAITAVQISANAVQSQHISAGSIQAVHIAAGVINAGHISAGSITGDRISGGTIDAGKLTVSARTQGLLAQYFTHSGGTNKFEVFKGSRVETSLNTDWVASSPSIVGTTNNFSVRFQGLIFIPQAGVVTFYAKADDAIKLWIDNTVVVDAWTGSSGIEKSGTFTATANTWYTINIEYTENTGNASFYVQWQLPSGVKENIPAMYLTQSQTIIDGGTILTNTITASSMKVGTITAASGIIGDAAIGTANIISGNITSALIANAAIQSAHIASANIQTVHIASGSITDAKIAYLDAGKIQSGTIDANRIGADSISANNIAADQILTKHIAAFQIEADMIKAGQITAQKIAAGSITGDRIAADTITGTNILAASITAEHITTRGLDANIVSVYNPQTGQVLIGGGYLRVDGLDVGVVQSDNLIGNGLFLTASSGYGLKRMNEAGEAILGSISSLPGAHEVWKFDVATGAKVGTLSSPSMKKPVDFAIDTDGTYGYVTIQGDNTVAQVDMANFTLTGKTLNMGMGPAEIMYTGDMLQDMKHFFVLNQDPSDHHVPDSLIVIDAPPTSVDAELYTHHWMEIGHTPYDMVMDSGKQLYITQAGSGDIAVIDMSDHNSMKWKLNKTIPIAAYMTDNYHGGLEGFFGLGHAVGGSSSATYDENGNGSMGGMDMSGMAGMNHTHSGYGDPSGSLKTYEPHGIALSSDSDHLYVCDFKNNELLVVDKTGKAPYNNMTGMHTVGNMGAMSGDVGSGDMTGMDGMDMGNMPIGNSPATAYFYTGGGPTTSYVRYRIPIGSAPDYVIVANGKVFVSLQGSAQVAVIDEQDILDEIIADRAFYGVDGYNQENPFQPLRDLPTFYPRYIDVGSKPAKMIANGGNLHVVVAGQSQLKRIDTVSETVTRTTNVGPNPKGITFSNDNTYMYVVNHGGSGDMSFVYPKGTYIGDAFVGLEGGINLQGAEFWVPDRNDWVQDASGNVRSYSTVEFRINEPNLNEGGYAKFTLVSKEADPVFAQIEQDITTVINYSNGSNLITATDERIIPIDLLGNTIFEPRNGWINSPAPTFKVWSPISGGSGGFASSVPATNKYTVTYGDVGTARVTFSGGVVPSGGYVTSSYTARNNIYFKPHNGSIVVAAENGTSPNVITEFQIDEFVPKFVVLDNQQTTPFTPTADGISEEYTGLEYSLITNRAAGKAVTSSVAPVSGNTLITNFVSKVAVSTVENPHMAKATSSASLRTPTDTWSEFSTTNYGQISALDASRAQSNNTTSTFITQQLFSFDLIATVERMHGKPIPGTNTAAKVAWLDANVSKFVLNWYGYGSSPTGNKATVRLFNSTGQSWAWATSNSTSSASLVSVPFVDGRVAGVVSDFIDANGFFHAIAHAEASNGTIASVINTDYIELQITVNLPSSTTSLSVITDDVQPYEEHGDHSGMDMFADQPFVTLPSGLQYVQIDLGKKYMIGQVTVSHMFEDFDRIYHNTKTQVSEDGVTWTTVYDSAVSGEYNEKAVYHPLHGHTHYAKVIAFNAMPVRYVRDYANGWTSADGKYSGSNNHWTEIKAYGDWEVEENYFYPAGSEFAGQQMATNGKSIVTTDIQDAYVAYDMQIEFTAWWYMTYLVGPEFGRLKVDMSSMSGSHFLNLDSPFLNKVAHRHIMPFTPSQTIEASGDVKAGKHRATIRQVSGKISLDRIRVEDFQLYDSNSLDVSNQTVSSYSRKKIVAEQAKWYQGIGRQTTEGAYDAVRKNPDTGVPDNSVPIKYRFRVKSTLEPSGATQETGVVYVTSAIFETGKLHTHWRRSESVDSIPANKIQMWDANQPMNTGIQHDHIANGAIRGTKILPHAIMDYHISPYAKIEETKLNLKYPTHGHGKTIMVPMEIMPGMTVDMPVFISNKDFLDSLEGFAGSGGTYGTGNAVARADHNHDYLSGSGGTISGNTVVTGTLGVTGGTTLRGAVTALGGLNVTGNIVVSGTVDGVDVSVLNTSFNNHNGSGGSAHALATASANGFLSSTDFSKLAGIQSGAINQTTADGRYLLISGGAAKDFKINSTELQPFIFRRNSTDTESVSQSINDNTYSITYTNDEVSSIIQWQLNNTDTESGGGVSANGGNVKITQDKTNGTKLWVNSNMVWHEGNFVTGNYYTKTQVDSLVTTAGNIKAENANVFTYAGLAVKIQPSANVASSTKVLQINNFSGVEQFSVSADATTIRGNLIVQGTTQYAGTTVVDGDYTITGNLNISGNTVLGDASTDTTTVTGSLVIPSGSTIKQIGKEVEVMRFPLFGISGDMQFQTDNTAFDNIIDHYWTFDNGVRSCLPAVPAGATRKFKLLVGYSTVGVTSPATLRIVQQGTTTEITSVVLNTVQGGATGVVRTLISPAFTTAYTGHTTFQAKCDNAGTELGIKYIEVIAYDVY